MPPDINQIKIIQQKFMHYLLQNSELISLNKVTSDLNMNSVNHWALSTDEISSIMAKGTYEKTEKGLLDKLYMYQVAKIAEVKGIKSDDASRIALSCFGIAVREGLLK